MSRAIEYCIMSWELLVGWAGGSIKDMSKDELLFFPSEKSNHAWWLFGRSVLCADIARYLTDSPAMTPNMWQSLFGPGVSPSVTGEGYPSCEELIAQFEKNVDAVIASIKQMSDDQLNEPPATEVPESLRDFFSTKGKIITGYAYYCMCFHGQIMAIRRMLGKQSW